MKNKIVLFNILIIAVSLIFVFFFGVAVNRSTIYKEAEKSVIDITKIYAENYVSPEKTVNGTPDDIRVSVIASGGTVLADSENLDVGTLDNHDDREEIISAFKGEPKVVTRYSKSLKKDFVYYAEKVEIDSGYVFIRVSMPVENVNAYVVSNAVTMVFVLIFALLISSVLSAVASNGLLKPLKDVKNNLASIRNGTYKEVIPSSGDKEINSLLVEINGVGEKLSRSISEARSDKEKLDYILDNISDAIAVLDEQGNIVILNKNAQKIFDVSDYLGRSYMILCRESDFVDKINCALSGKTDENFELRLPSDKVYAVSVRPLERGLTAIVLSDITAVRNSEKMRSEFFANASHELKTPLTAIKGFNDIISLNAENPEIKELSGRINKETERIIGLINDMLDLSKLESTKKPDGEKLQLGDVVDEVKCSLEILAGKRGVEIESSGSGFVCMEHEHALELVKNLMENAVRYNEQGGHVKVTVTDGNGKTVLTVADDGIGIEEEHLGRIFERFYRVNKSRSRETGGTGLGLSIVKHICMLYGADLDFKSTYGVGTTVTVTFKS